MSSEKQKPKESAKAKTSPAATSLFPIVCIGASAGGLEALEQFLGNMPQNSGMAYIVIQHLDPTQKGMLPELLQRISKMEVFQAADRMAVKPNRVYVIPPNKSMSILKGLLHLFDPVESRGLRLPIDFFLRSLADDRKELGVAVILSGMGSDGSVGIRAIKEKNGIVLVQEPSNAKYSSMPQSAIDSVLADIVAPADELPARLLAYLNHLPVVKTYMENEIKDKSALEKIIILLRTQTGNDFSLYKKNTVYRRIERRMSVHKIDKIGTYIHFMQENPKEVEILFRELLIGVTNFFRDAPTWEKIKEEVIPDCISKLHDGSVIRAWVPGCSTGEEAFSLAIVFKEALEKFKPHSGISMQIFASDLDNESIETARKGIFPANIVADVSPNRLSRFFTKIDDGYRINTEIREMVVFAIHNVILHPPFTKIDILTCRNLLIYLDSELQKKLIGLFHYSINPEGYMILGSAETLGTQSQFFNTVDAKLKIYKRAVTEQSPELFDFPSSFSRSKLPPIETPVTTKPPVNIQTLADQLLLQHFSPPGVLINDKGDIVYVSGRTGKYLEPAVGKANMNIFAMLREGLNTDFPSAFRQAVLKRETVVLHNLKVGTNGGSQNVDIIVQWLDKPAPLSGMVLVVFNDLPKSAANKKRVVGLPNERQAELENELQQVREDMQSTREEMQTSQEELKSTNEELQSTNEELQSTNEELTTSKEEMQSLNEELQTVNAELTSKVNDFAWVNNDMKNLLNSTDIATLFLDKELNIRRFTIQATKIFKLINTDIGRPFTDQVSDLVYPDLSSDAIEVLRTLVFKEKQIPTKDGRWYTIRIMPYRTFDDRIDGLVITFVNNSDIKHMEGALLETEQAYRLVLSSSPEIIVRLSPDWKILEFNPEAEKFFGKKQKDLTNQSFIQLFVPVKDRKTTENELQKKVRQKVDTRYKMKVEDADGEIVELDWAVHILLSNLNTPAGLILIAKQ